MKFQKGNSLGKGRPRGSRSVITKQILSMLETELAKVAKGNVPGDLSSLREDHPEAFWRFAASLVPKEIDLDKRDDHVSFTMILHEPKPLETNETVIDAKPETLSIEPTQDSDIRDKEAITKD